jgi:hypothetical protein
VPTFEWVERFGRDWRNLGEAEQQRFREVIREEFVPDLDKGEGFRAGLRVKGVQGAPGVYEMTWAPDGRATWQYGPERRPGTPRIIWRRIGTHAIFRTP